jgi:trehalose 6-phosphate synthase
MIALAAIAYGIAPLVDKLTLRWFVRDMDIRANLIANAMHDPLVEQMKAGSKTRVANYFARVAQDERLYALGYCATPDAQPLATRSLPADTPRSPRAARSGPSARTTSDRSTCVTSRTASPKARWVA